MNAAADLAELKLLTNAYMKHTESRQISNRIYRNIEYFIE